MRYSKLNNFHQRRRFDPSNIEDRKELKYFIENNRWRDVCPFYAEYPWEDIPTMCKDKYSEYALGKI